MEKRKQNHRNWHKIAIACVLLLVLSFTNQAWTYPALGDETRDALNQELDDLGSTVDYLGLDNSVKLKSGKTHQGLVNSLLEEAKQKASDKKKSNTEVQKAIQAVRLAIVNPQLTKGTAEVPEGKILEDFVPQLIRIGFRVASVVILLAFIVAGVMMILSGESEDQLVKAKNIFYYSIIGFLIIVLAFAIVKAVTDIDFFGFA